MAYGNVVLLMGITSATVSGISGLLFHIFGVKVNDLFYFIVQ